VKKWRIGPAGLAGPGSSGGKNGYTYCLDPQTGEQRWYNELKGFGSGVTSIATLGKDNLRDLLLAAAAADEAAAAASSASTSAMGSS